MRTTAGGARTLYLPGIEYDQANGATSATRTVFYTIAATMIAVRNNAGALAWNCANQQNSTTCTTPANPTSTPPTLPQEALHPLRQHRRNTNTTAATNHGYLGQPEDTTGLTYLNNRYHNPTLGIFISVDPLVAKTGTPYQYAAGNPTTLSDPSGLCTVRSGMHSYDDGKGPCGGGGSHGSCAGRCDGSVGVANEIGLSINERRRVVDQFIADWGVLPPRSR